MSATTRRIGIPSLAPLCLPSAPRRRKLLGKPLSTSCTGGDAKHDGVPTHVQVESDKVQSVGSRNMHRHLGPRTNVPHLPTPQPAQQLVVPRGRFRTIPKNLRIHRPLVLTEPHFQLGRHPQNYYRHLTSFPIFDPCG